jgi:arginase family enzyme
MSEQNSLQNSTKKIISVPFSGGGLGHGNGANEGPAVIIEQLKELFADEQGNAVSFDTSTILTLDEQHIANSHASISQASAKETEKVIFLGGDHSITHPLVQGFATQQKDFCFLVFDAHPDLMDDFRPPTQEDYLRVIIEEGLVQPEDITLVGVRNWDSEEVNYLKEKGIRCITMQEVFDKGIKTVMEEVKSRLTKPTYFSLDIDVVDPVEAIGTGYLEHGGMSSRERFYALQELKQTGKLARVDLVEVNPYKDIKDMTAKLAAKCLIELAHY